MSGSSRFRCFRCEPAGLPRPMGLPLSYAAAYRCGRKFAIQRSASALPSLSEGQHGDPSDRPRVVAYLFIYRYTISSRLSQFPAERMASLTRNCGDGGVGTSAASGQACATAQTMRGEVAVDANSQSDWPRTRTNGLTNLQSSCRRLKRQLHIHALCLAKHSHL